MRTFNFSAHRNSNGSYELKCGKLNLNNIEGVQRLVQALTQIIAAPTAWHRQRCTKDVTFGYQTDLFQAPPAGMSYATVRRRPYT